MWCCVLCVLWCCGASVGCVFKIFVGASKICSPLRRTSLRRTAQNFALLFLSRHNFHSFFPLSGSLLVEFCWCVLAGTLKCARLGSPNVHISGPPRFKHQKTPREGRKKENCGGRGEKKLEILGPHPSGPHPSGPCFCPPWGTGGREREDWPSRKNLYDIFLGLSRKKGLVGPSRIGLSRIGPSRACPNQSPLHF